MSKIHQSMKVGATMGLYDSATNKTIYCDKVLKVSKDCVVKYASDSIGRIAQINDLLPDGRAGSMVHYHVDQMTTSQLATDVVFKRFVSVMGLDPVELAAKIIANA
jgi:hypothetical protein